MASNRIDFRRICKLPILFLCVFGAFASAFAEDGVKVVERKTCEQIKSEIADLAAITNPTAEQQANLSQLYIQQRSYCSIKSTGRRAISRSLPTSGGDATQTQSSRLDVLTEYLATKRANCEKLGAEIENMGDDATVAWIVREMQRYYDADCALSSDSDIVAETIADAIVVPVAQTSTGAALAAVAVSNKTDEEIAAEFEANLAAGLCGDGTRPNRFGCCAGETFTDMGNTVFACCPKTGGDCFPPVTPVK